jgi:hypothetical protein
VQVSDAGVRVLATSGSVRLTSLNLWGCHCVTDGGLQALGAALKGLTALNLSLCHLVTDTGLRALGGGLSKLKTLDLWACEQVGVHTSYHIYRLEYSQEGVCTPHTTSIDWNTRKRGYCERCRHVQHGRREHLGRQSNPWC